LRQSRATTLAKEHFALVKDSQEVICFAKYRDVLLRNGVTRITSVHFDETQKNGLSALPVQQQYDSRIYEVDTANTMR
jgi:N6-adenosine-specific RNA methylase IME4